MLSSYKHTISILWTIQNEVIFSMKKKVFWWHYCWTSSCNFCAMCWILKTCTKFYVIYPLSLLKYALFIDSRLSEIKHKPCCGVSCLFKFLEEEESCFRCITLEIAKALFLPSFAIVTKRVPLCLSYNHVPLTWATSLQYWNTSIHDLKLQKRWWNIMKPFTFWPHYAVIGSVSFSTTIPGRSCCIACNNLSKSWNDLFQLS